MSKFYQKFSRVLQVSRFLKFIQKKKKQIIFNNYIIKFPNDKKRSLPNILFKNQFSNISASRLIQHL